MLNQALVQYGYVFQMVIRPEFVTDHYWPILAEFMGQHGYSYSGLHTAEDNHENHWFGMPSGRLNGLILAFRVEPAPELLTEIRLRFA